MATINTIRKQIETATKRMESAKAKIAMYDERTANTIAKAAKATGMNVTIDNYDKLLSTIENWEWRYKIECNIDSKKSNEKIASKEVEMLKLLNVKLTKMEQSAAEKEIANSALKVALSDVMSDFKKCWFEKMINWYSAHYDIMRNALPEAIERRKKCDRIERNYMYDFLRMRKYHIRMYNFVKAERHKAIEIIFDNANRMDKVRYMSEVNTMLVNSWEKGIDKLADKCKSFGIDENKIKVENPEMTEKGFEVLITDGKARNIYARVIWAAEYSSFVMPHTRYIVTERTK
jgi:hypothetical protein